MRRLRLILITVLLLALASGVCGQTLKLAADLEALLANPLSLLQPVNVVIQYNSAPGLLDILQIVGLGGTVKTQYTLIPALSVTLPLGGVTTLLADLNVLYVTPDRALGASLD